MAGTFNKVILVGNLTRDPEIKYIGSGAAVTKFTLAVNRRTKQGDECDFIDCVAWEKLAETCNTYLHKGSSCLVEGRLSIRSYETKEGEKRKAAEIVLHSMQMLDKANRNTNEPGSYDNNDELDEELEQQPPQRQQAPSGRQNGNGAGRGNGNGRQQNGRRSGQRSAF